MGLSFVVLTTLAIQLLEHKNTVQIFNLDNLTLGMRMQLNTYTKSGPEALIPNISAPES